MANILDYLYWRGDLGFETLKFNEVDSLVLCALSYLPLDNIVASDFYAPSVTIAKAAGQLLAKKDGAHGLDASQRRLLELLAQSRRFGVLYLSGFVNQVDAAAEKQFCATTILLDSDEAYVAFRGTDNTLVGWKEDFNMAYITPVPAQAEAVRYLERACLETGSALYTGGHSKGGNLAVYAATYCKKSVQDRILAVYNNDGPGFLTPVLLSEPYKRVRSRVNTYVPQSSVVGMLLDHEEDYDVVHSTQTGLMQHDLYSWETTPDSFVLLDSVDESSKKIDRTLKSWIAGLSLKEREIFVDVLFQILSATGAKTLSELTDGWLNQAGRFLRYAKNMDASIGEHLAQLISLLASSAKGEVSALKNNGV